MTKQFNLEKRLLTFSTDTIHLCKLINITLINKNLITQLLKSATSIGANYTEANDSLGKKDFLHRLRIARKEAKETLYWLNLLIGIQPKHLTTINKLITECTELRNILSAIINKSK